MLSDKLNELEERIKELENINGFKKSIIEHNKIRDDLDKCKININELENFVNEISVNINTNEITDDQFQEYFSEIKSLAEIFDKLEINEKILVYQNAITKIKICDNYLKSRKMEIIYIN